MCFLKSQVLGLALMLGAVWLSVAQPTGLAAALSEAAPQNTAMVPAPKLEDDFYDWYQRHEAVLNTIEKQPVELVFIGDSITHMFGGAPVSRIARGGDTWERYYGHRHAVNMGFGWDRTQNVLWRIDQGELDGISPKVVVLLIGTNNRSGTQHARQNTPVEIAEGIAAICERIHEKVPSSHILLLGVLPRSPAEHVAPIREINMRIAPLSQEAHITFLDMHDVFAGTDGLPRKGLMLPDGVHPSAAGYALWAQTMEPVLCQLLGDAPVVPDAAEDLNAQGVDTAD